MKLNELTIVAAHAGLMNGEFTSLALTEACLQEIEARDGELGAFLFVDAAGAREAAKASDARRAKGETLSRLDGIPVAVKDNILVSGMQATAGSKMLAEYVASYDATVVTKLKAAGAVILGKTNMDEFAMGSSNETSAFKKAKNPLDPTRVPGGSSGGSAVAVAAHMAFAALGTDTGGSIRQPASFCGVVGLKPTYGRVSRFGSIAMASSLDQIGTFTKTVEDAAIMLQILEGADPHDATSVAVDATVPEALSQSLSGLRIGVPREYFVDGMDPLVAKSVREAIADMQEMGAEIVDISLPHTKHALACYYVIMPAEVSSNLARFDGIRYGTRIEGTTLEEGYRGTRGHLFGAEPKRRIMIGTYVLSSGYYDAYYDKAQRVRALLKQDFDAAWKQVDVIVSPTAPSVAFKFGEKIDDPIGMYLSDIYTVSTNLVGVPGISVPCGFAHGLPVGLQFMAKSFDERTLLRAAHAFSAQRNAAAHVAS